MYTRFPGVLLTLQTLHAQEERLVIKQVQPEREQGQGREVIRQLTAHYTTNLVLSTIHPLRSLVCR